MSEYVAPLKDMQFLFNEMGLLRDLSEMPATAEATSDLVTAILEEASKLSTDLISTCNISGDLAGSQLIDGQVKTPEGFKEAYQAMVEGGWNGLSFPEENGGSGMPFAIASAIMEMFQSANMAWALAPLLTQGATKALLHHGSPELVSIYGTKMVTNEWSGTMNLTEAAAGSDLAHIRTKAEPHGDHYLVKGQKIFITYGDHDQAENVIHLVLARLPDAPEGTRGISLFLVPKFLVNADGSLGARNDAHPIKVEHKLGIHGSPTCVMSFGEHGGAVGYLIGEENRGLEYMFTMMNHARLAVGGQGLSLSERAYQRAVSYAKDRKQGRHELTGEKYVPIINHADVRRMLMTMRAYIEAMRALHYRTMVDIDIQENHPEEGWRDYANRRVDLITPVIKGWFTDLSVELTSMGVQVHGGMGFIEETGAAQYYRDARILPIYEGTNGIQAADLVHRKIIRDNSAAFDEYIEELNSVINRLNADQNEHIAVMRAHLAAGIDALDKAGEWVIENAKDITALNSASTYLLKLFGIVAGGSHLANAMTTALEKIEKNEGDTAFYNAKISTARFYAENILSQAPALLVPIREGHHTLRDLPDDIF